MNEEKVHPFPGRIPVDGEPEDPEVQAARNGGAIMAGGMNMKKDNKVAERIRTYREKLDMSVCDLAQRSGVDEKLVNAIEKGDVRPITISVVRHGLRALGGKPASIYGVVFVPF